MKKLMLFWIVLTWMIIRVYSVDIKMDPGMKEGQPSYIYCDVGTVTGGVIFYTEPGNVQGNCIAPGAPCSSTLYTVTKNTTRALLKIASVDASREGGDWYCQHDTDRSTNTISLNARTIAGALLRTHWTETPGTVYSFFAMMTLPCTNRVQDDFTFTYEDSESKTEAVSTTTLSSYDGTTCENGNKFYEITLTASNSLDFFNNKQGVKFSFIYYGNSITVPFIVDFTDRHPKQDDKWIYYTVGTGTGLCTTAAMAFGGFVYVRRRRRQQEQRGNRENSKSQMDRRERPSHPGPDKPPPNVRV